MCWRAANGTGYHLDKLQILGAAGAGDMCTPGLGNLHCNTAHSSTASMNQHTLSRLHLSRLKSLHALAHCCNSAMTHNAVHVVTVIQLLLTCNYKCPVYTDNHMSAYTTQMHIAHASHKQVWLANANASLCCMQVLMKQIAYTYVACCWHLYHIGQT